LNQLRGYITVENPSIKL